MLSAVIVFLTIVTAILMPFRLYPLAEHIPSAWSALGFCIYLLTLSISRILSRKPMHWFFPLWTWVGLVILLFFHSLFTLADHKDALIFPLGCVLLAGSIHFSAMNESDSNRITLSSALAWAFYIASMGTLFFQIYQLTDAEWLGRWVLPLPQDMQPYGNVGQRNEVAFIHVLAIAGITHNLKKRINNLTWLLVAGFSSIPMILGLTLTSSRLFLFLGGLIFCICAKTLFSAYQQQHLHNKLSTWSSMAISSAFLMLYALIYTGCSYGVDLFPHHQTFDSVTERISNVSNVTRIALQQQAWAMFIEKPIIGQGWGSFSAFGLQWSDRSLLPLFADHSHFFISHILAEMGIIGIIVVSPVLWLIYISLTSKHLWSDCFFPQAFCFTTVVYSFSEFPLWNGYFLFSFSLAMGLLSGKLLKIKTNNTTNQQSSNTHTGTITQNNILISPSWIGLIAILLGIGTVSTSWNYIQLHSLAQHVFVGKKVEPYVFDKINEIKNPLGFSAIKELYIFLTMPIDTNNLAEKILMGERATKHFTDSHVLLQLALLYGLNNEEDKAYRIMQDACRFYPKKCSETYSKMNTLPNVNNHIYQRINNRLDDWWQTNPRNPLSSQSR